MSYGVLECDIVVTESHAYDFVKKKGGGIICAGPCIVALRGNTDSARGGRILVLFFDILKIKCCEMKCTSFGPHG